MDGSHLARRVLEEGLLSSDVLFGEDALPVVDGYEVERPIGRGGAGVVYLARDTNLQRQVALKFLHNAGPADVARLRREARFTARLDNPAILPVYALGEAEGRPYIAMQFVDGESLGRARIDLYEIARVLRDVALALEHAHAEGIVHRDIKPENILIDRRGRVFLTDFGIARDLRGRVGETLSREGQIMGTPGLMSPEQARGDVQAVDARSDVYALGGTLYYCLTGRFPFTGKSVVDVLHAVIHDDPPLLRSRNATIPRALEAICLRCLQKNRDDRYQSMREVADDLDRFLAGSTVGAESATWFKKLVAKIVGAPEPQPDPEHEREDDPYWSEGLEIVRDLAAWDADLYRVSGSLGPAFARLDAIGARLEGILADRPDTAWARFYRGSVRFRRGDLERALEDMERAIDRVRNLAGAYFELGRLYLAVYLAEQREARKHISVLGVDEALEAARGRLDQAVVVLDEAWRLRGELPPWYRDYARAVTRLAQSDFAGCVAFCDAALERDPDLEEVWKLRGDAQHLGGLDPVESYERALDVRRSYYEALCAMAGAHLERGELSRAREALERARRIRPEHVESLALLARTYLRESGAAADGEHDELLTRGLGAADDALSVDPGHYEATVTAAELLHLQARSRADDGLFARALELLRAAWSLAGCQNRVRLLEARATYDRAMNGLREGRDTQAARAALERAQELCLQVNARVPDNEPWRALRSDVEDALTRIGAG